MRSKAHAKEVVLDIQVIFWRGKAAQHGCEVRKGGWGYNQLLSRGISTAETLRGAYELSSHALIVTLSSFLTLLGHLESGQPLRHGSRVAYRIEDVSRLDNHCYDYSP